MTEEQRKLLEQIAKAYDGLAEECMNDDSFHDLMTVNNDLFPRSLDEMGDEWRAILEGEKR